MLRDTLGSLLCFVSFFLFLFFFFFFFNRLLFWFFLSPKGKGYDTVLCNVFLFSFNSKFLYNPHLHVLCP